MTVLVRIRLTVATQNTVGMLLVETQSVFEQSDPGSEQSRLGRHAHRRTEDSILLIMAAMMPLHMPFSKRQSPGTTSNASAMDVTALLSVHQRRGPYAVVRSFNLSAVPLSQRDH